MILYNFSNRTDAEVAIRPIREDLHRCLLKNRQWKWIEGEICFHDLVFSRHVQTVNMWHFELFNPKTGQPAGCGTLTKKNSSKKVFYEYMVMVLSNGLTVEAWTYNSELEKTYLSLNGKIRGSIKSFWEKGLLGCSWLQKWEFYFDERCIGSAERGDYLFAKRLFVRSLVRADTLKLKIINEKSIPIVLAPQQGNASSFLLLPLRLVPAMSGQRFDKADYVVPLQGKLSKEDVFWGFVINIVFRELFFNMTYPDIGG